MTKTARQTASITKLLGISLLGMIVILYLLFKFKGAAPPPDCMLSEKTGFTGEQMWDFGIKNSVFFRKRPDQAACWFEKSATKGYLNAFGSIARAYENGDGVVQNHETAIQWHLKGMKLNNSGSFFLLAKMYESGRGVNKNTEKAIELYQAAAKLGNGGARKALERLKK
jgi:TPR repeat protein